MLKRILFQLHLWLGLTAGIVLAVVGVTGAALSYEDEILRWLNPGVVTVQARDAPVLTPAALAIVLAARDPEARITAITVAAEPILAARVIFAPAQGGGGRRGVQRYVDPTNGELLGEPVGEDAFQLIRQIHRWLAAGAVGRQIVGASTVALVVISIVGLYLRWPRRPLDWRAWFKLDLRRRARSLFWELHSVIGTWVLPLYLLAGLTGLYWSYGWYRDFLYEVTGAPRPNFGGPPQAGAQPQADAGRPVQRNEGQQQRGEGPAQRGGRPAEAQRAARGPDLALAWETFRREVPAFSRATVRLPAGPGQPLQIAYVDADAPHDRATNTLVLTPTGVVASHRRYDALPLGHRLMTSMLPLHSGEFFGPVVKFLMMVASLVMPLFAVTGWLLYLGRQRLKRAARGIARRLPAPQAAADPWLIAFASQGGAAERLAWQSASALQAEGMAVRVQPLGRLDGTQLAAAKRALFVVSTFGEGEPPDSARGFARRVMCGAAALEGVRYGLLALGDHSYRRFCGFGRDLDFWLRRHGATPLFVPVEVSRASAQSIDQWRQALGVLAGAPLREGFAPEAGQSWRLSARRELNPGSPGGAVFHVTLTPAAGVDALWTPGDVAELHVPAGAGSATVMREYSIGSIADSGAIDLTVRRVRRADGSLGQGSGWLTESAPLDSTIALRVRSNPGFHPPDDDRPMILIGNGTGIAGLRAHLQHRAQRGIGRNWLLFGERTLRCDFHYRDEIEMWRAQGLVERVDLAFSRDQDQRIYVQHRLREAGAELRRWLDCGAAVYVCGSIAGMAPAVHDVLSEVAGVAALELMAENGAYCREVY